MFGDAAADVVLREAVLADMRAAHLSPAFRAYYSLRSLIPIPVRQMLQRHRGIETSPRWAFPDACIEALAIRVAEVEHGITMIHPWPDGADFAFVLTHDVETADGMRNIMPLVELEERLGFRSSWNIVPHKYEVDHGLLRELRARGFEIGVHGYNHDGKLFCSRRVFEQRVLAINAALATFGAVGFRAPMVHRNLVWLQELNIEYDASCFDADPYQAMPGGAGGIWPFIAGRFVELPYTLPQDHTLLIALGQRDGRLWTEKIRYLADLCGMALLVTHPDYLDSPHRRDLYDRFLHEVRGMEGVWQALPREVAAWWRDRDRSSLWREERGWIVSGPAAERGRVVTVHAKKSDSCNAIAYQIAPRLRFDKCSSDHLMPAAVGARKNKSINEKQTERAVCDKVRVNPQI
jgi:peptidoglycan/xylan/chitin deacetylase (PgdA/CDA1 family)